jgi:hypothetical protein
MSNIELYPLGSAARMLRVPASWLRQEAVAGRVPHLAAGKRLLFDVPTVARILQRRATKDAQAVGDV